MTGRLDWRRAKTPRPTESALGSDVELRDGSRTPKVCGDRLAYRAERAADQWLRSLPPAERAKAMRALS